MRGGVRRLLLLTASPRRKAVEAGLSAAGRLAVVRSGRSLDDLLAQCIDAAADRVLADFGDLPFTAESFDRLRRRAKEVLHEHAADALAPPAPCSPVRRAWSSSSSGSWRRRCDRPPRTRAPSSTG